jgi:hypothetical protein
MSTRVLKEIGLAVQVVFQLKGVTRILNPYLGKFNMDIIAGTGRELELTSQ